MGCPNSKEEEEPPKFKGSLVDSLDEETTMVKDGRTIVYVKQCNVKYLHSERSDYLSTMIDNCNNKANYSLITEYLIENGIGRKELEKNLDDLVITAYTGNSLFRELNTSLNNGKLTKGQEAYAQCLCRSIIRRGKSQNLPAKLYRKVQLEEDGSSLGYFDKVGKVICFRTFISTSRNEKVLRKWKGNMTFEFIVNNALQAADITKFSQFQEEEEVLMIPNQLFKVKRFVTEEGEDGELQYLCILEAVEN